MRIAERDGERDGVSCQATRRGENSRVRPARYTAGGAAGREVRLGGWGGGAYRRQGWGHWRFAGSGWGCRRPAAHAAIAAQRQATDELSAERAAMGPAPRVGPLAPSLCGPEGGLTGFVRNRPVPATPTEAGADTKIRRDDPCTVPPARYDHELSGVKSLRPRRSASGLFLCRRPNSPPAGDPARAKQPAGRTAVVDAAPRGPIIRSLRASPRSPRPHGEVRHRSSSSWERRA